jgi:hypothetical protein
MGEISQQLDPVSEAVVLDLDCVAFRTFFDCPDLYRLPAVAAQLDVAKNIPDQYVAAGRQVIGLLKILGKRPLESEEQREADNALLHHPNNP